MWSEKYRDEIVRLASELVAIPTVNCPPNGNEAPGQARLRAYYEAMGLAVDAFSPEEVPEYPHHPEFMARNLKGRENLVATWKGKGGGKSLVITGHMDVVPEAPLPWTVTEAFRPHVSDGRLYGRGSADMKGALAAGAVAVKYLKDIGFTPRGDVLLESVVDEEYAGANGTIAARLKGYNPDFAIIPEASGLDVCPACVGGLVLKITVRGIAGMPYTGEEIGNPAYDIADIASIVRDFGAYRVERTPRPALWSAQAQGAQIVVTKMRAGEAYESGQLSSPIDAWMEIVMQSYPGETADELEAQLWDYIRPRYRNPDGLQIERVYHYCRPAATDENHPAVKTLRECAEAVKPGAKVCGAMFSCDMFAVTDVGHVPCAIFGPVGARLHAPDEWVDIESLCLTARALAEFIVKWCG